MRLRGVHIVLLLLCLSSCGPKRIPRGDMEKIMARMLIQDQQIKLSRELKRSADTTLVYEGIFQAYGYDTDDFLKSLSYYLGDPSKMEKIMGNVASVLEKEAKEVQEAIDFQRWKDDLLRIYGMTPDTAWPRPRPRAADSLPLRFSGDSIRLERPEDSLKRIPRDSLLFLRDSL